MIIKDHTRIDLAQGGTRFKQGDFVELAFTPRDAAGKVVDLTGKDIEVSIWNRSKGVIYQGAASFDSAEKLIRVTIKETLDHGKFQIEFTVTDSTDADYRRKFPSDEYNGVINITPSTDNMDVVGVQMTTVTQLRNEQQQLQQEFESQVLPRVDTVEDKQTQLEADYQAAAGALTEDSEVILARKGEPTLRAFNDKITTQLAEKAGLAEVRKNTNIQPINVNEMDTETKQLFTGGSVAVVGEKAVGSENLKDLAVRFTHTDFLEYGDNFFNPYTAKDGFSVNSGGVELADATYSLSEPIPADSGELYIIVPNNTTIKRPTFYDLNGDYVATIFSSTSTLPIEYTPPQDGFIRVPVLTTGKFNVSVSKKNVQPSFVPFRIKGKNYLFTQPEAGSVGSVELQDGVVTAQKTDFLEPSKNLFNKNDEGVLPDTILGTSTPNTSYETSGYMSIYEGQSYTVSHPRRYETTDVNKVNKNTVDVNPIAETTFTATADGFLQVSYLKTDRDVMQVEIGEEKTEYEEYGKVKIPGLILPGQSNPLAGKKILNFGDSISAASFGYHAIIAEKNNMTFRNLGAGGYTVTSVNGSTNTIISRVNTAISEGQQADYILFNGLTNDANVLDASLAGTVSEGYNATLDMTTFAGSFEHLVKTLITTWQDSKIIYIRPHNMDSRDSRQILYGDLALDICRKWSIPFVDMYNEGGLNSNIPELKVKYTVDTYSTGLGDGTHPNADGYEMYYAPRIEAKMRSI